MTLSVTPIGKDWGATDVETTADTFLGPISTENGRCLIFSRRKFDGSWNVTSFVYKHVHVRHVEQNHGLFRWIIDLVERKVHNGPSAVSCSMPIWLQ